MTKQTRSNWQNMFFGAIAVAALLLVGLSCESVKKFTNQSSEQTKRGLEQTIIGKWETQPNDTSYVRGKAAFEFKPDKTMSTYLDDSKVEDGNYRILDEENIEFINRSSSGKEIVEKARVKIEGGKMTIYRGNNKELVLIKK